MAKYRVLIAYGTKTEFTQAIAEEVAAVLREDGLDVEVRPAAEIVSVGPYDAVVLGGELRANRWHRDARRFARRHSAQLRSRPVWFFSSGTSDASDASKDGGADVPPVPSARRAMNQTGARGHLTVGGRPGRLPRGLFDRGGAARSSAARDLLADHPEMFRVRDWAHHIANEVTGS
ncbi:flavodoxin domain-containing protein [Streptomyces sp. Ru73]|uniref:flavodoxin domain-containing protein n=1 Tax=Streptomyces sp. Ru73 TaxID=2080748 RepID=UPI002156136F|nr:flavodoxin domain-containing protein [Streptomyces sp. Ru73]